MRESQRKRGASVELVDQVMEIFAEHKTGEYRTSRFTVEQVGRKSTGSTLFGDIGRSVTNGALYGGPPVGC